MQLLDFPILLTLIDVKVPTTKKKCILWRLFSYKLVFITATIYAFTSSLLSLNLKFLMRRLKWLTSLIHEINFQLYYCKAEELHMNP